jgi:hypothetical protein
VKFGIRYLQVILEIFCEFCEFGEGERSFSIGRKWTYVYWCTVKPNTVMSVKNAFAFLGKKVNNAFLAHINFAKSPCEPEQV